MDHTCVVKRSVLTKVCGDVASVCSQKKGSGISNLITLFASFLGTLDVKLTVAYFPLNLIY